MTISNIVAPDGKPVEIAKGRGDLTRTSVPASSWGYARGIAQISGKQISYAQLFAEQVWVAAAVGWLMRNAIRVPFKCYRRTGDDSRERVRPEDHPLAAALVTPWDGASQIQLIWSLLGPLLVHGNALDEVQEGGHGKIQFQPADWRFALPIQPWRDVIAGWELDLDDNTISRTRAADQVLHVATWSSLGPTGISPLSQLGTTIAIEDAAQRHQKSILRNGTRTAAAIVADKAFLDNTTPEERGLLMDNLRNDVTDIYSGPDRSGLPAVLPPGLDWKPAGQTAVEAALIEQREISRLETHATYGVAPGCLGLFADNVDVDAQRQMSYQEGLAPPLLLIEAFMNAQIVQRLLREPDLYVEADFSGIMRGDTLREIQALREAISTAMLTPNEARTIRNMPKSNLPGMDSFYLPRNNLWPLDVPYPAKGMGGEQAAAASAALRAAADKIDADAALLETEDELDTLDADDREGVPA